MNARHGISEEVSTMSTMVAAHDFTFPRTRSHRSGAVRLTRRGRLTLLVSFVVLAFALISVFGGHSAATGEAGQPVETRTVVVGAGDTLWGIASELAEPGQVQEMVHHIQQLNALPGAGLMQGQRLAVPVE